MQNGPQVCLTGLLMLFLVTLTACGGARVISPVVQTSLIPPTALTSTIAAEGHRGEGLSLPSPTATSTSLISLTSEATPTTSHTPTPSITPTPGLAGMDYGPWDHVFSLGWAPEGDLLAVGAGRKVYLYRPEQLDNAMVLDTGGWATGLSFSPSLASVAPASRLLAISLRDGSVQIWDTGYIPGNGSSQPICKLEAHRKGANSVAFSPDGLTLATTGNDAMVRLWDMAGLRDQGSCELTLMAEMIGGARSVPDIQYHPEGLILASVDRSAVRLRDVSNQRMVTTLRAPESLLTIAFNPDGKLLAAAGIGDLVSVWDVATSELRYSFQLALPSLRSTPNALVWDVAFSPGGDFLVAAANDGRLYLWRMEQGVALADPSPEYPFQTVDAHRRAVTCLAFSPDGHILVSGSLDASVRLWPVEGLLRPVPVE